jgi:putative transposase
MRKSRFSEEQVLSILKEQDAGFKVVEICRKHGITEATFHNWKNKYGGMSTEELTRLRLLEQENSRLKRAVADLTLDNQILRDVNSKKW